MHHFGAANASDTLTVVELELGGFIDLWGQQSGRAVETGHELRSSSSDTAQSTAESTHTHMACTPFMDLNWVAWLCMRHMAGRL